MKNTPLLLLIFILVSPVISGQVAVSNDGTLPAGSAMLDVKSTSKGMLPPRMTTAQRDAIVSPAAGLLIYNTDCSDLQYYNGAGWVPGGNAGALTTPVVIGNSTACANSIGNAYTVFPVAGATGYNWTVPPGASIVSGQGSAAVAVAFGTMGGKITVSAFDACSKSSMISMTVTLIPSIPVSVNIMASLNPVCEGVSATMHAFGTNGGTSPQYQWKVNNVSIPGATNTTFMFQPVNNDAVACVFTSNISCPSGNPATSNTVIMLTQPWVQPTISIAASPNPVYSGNPVTFNATFTNGGSSPSFQWKVNDVNAGTNSSTFTYTPSNGDNVRCIFTTSISQCVTDYYLPSNIISMIVYTTGTACPGTSTVLYLGKTYNTVLIGSQCWLRENLDAGTIQFIRNNNTKSYQFFSCRCTKD